MSQALQSLLDNNRQWADKTVKDDPKFFTRLLQQQTPQYLWIGCADSRVPANELVNLAPGELFVHRNIANVVAHSDLNGLSVIQFATDSLKVKHIMVVGHSNCGGVRAALEDQRVGLADNWIRHVKDVRSLHQAWLDTLPASDQLNALCELNVVEQALNVCQSPSTQDAWERGQPLSVHGWVYGLQNGLLQDLTMSVNSPAEVQNTYAQALAHVRARHTAQASH